MLEFILAQTAEPSILNVDPEKFYSLVFYACRFLVIQGVCLIITGAIYRL